MNTREDFESHLDEHPDDWEFRSVYADWLESQGLEECESQRWMVANRKHSTIFGRDYFWFKEDILRPPIWYTRQDIQALGWNSQRLEDYTPRSRGRPAPSVESGQGNLPFMYAKYVSSA